MGADRECSLPQKQQFHIKGKEAKGDESSESILSLKLEPLLASRRMAGQLLSRVGQTPSPQSPVQFKDSPSFELVQAATKRVIV